MCSLYAKVKGAKITGWKRLPLRLNCGGSANDGN